MNLTIRKESIETYKHVEVTEPNYNTVYIFLV